MGKLTIRSKRCNLLHMASKRTTLRDIAQAAGIHCGTVSRALKDNPLVAVETRERVQRIAKEMGYVPDPMLSALTRYRWKTRTEQYRATIAWVTNGYSRTGWRCDTFSLYFQGAQERAASLGYALEEFWLREPGMNWRRNSEVLRARGIAGLILAPQPRVKMRVRLDWQNFSAVAIGYTTFSPHLHLVTNDQFQSMTTAVRKIRACGYRRIALCVGSAADGRVDHRWTGGFLAQQQAWPQSERLPILFNTNSMNLKDWIKEYQPDVVLGWDEIMPLIREAGYRMPEDIGFAVFGFPSLNQNVSNISGINENPFETGAAAVDLLVGMMGRGERGIPEIHRRILIEGTWFNGTTLRSGTA